ncbi:hypothetical protein C8J57DRAFT_412910 [Mycena rebaudengoi]|nr:hypothetical protein C8J57DRAFT_412910 [Mycena rebaudengoi]
MSHAPETDFVHASMPAGSRPIALRRDIGCTRCLWCTSFSYGGDESEAGAGRGDAGDRTRGRCCSRRAAWAAHAPSPARCPPRLHVDAPRLRVRVYGAFSCGGRSRLGEFSIGGADAEEGRITRGWEDASMSLMSSSICPPMTHDANHSCPPPLLRPPPHSRLCSSTGSRPAWETAACICPLSGARAPSSRSPCLSCGGRLR